MAWAPGLRAALDLSNAAALIAPGPLLLQAARETLFRWRGCAARRFRGAFYDEPHSFSPRMREDAFEWLRRSL